MEYIFIIYIFICSSDKLFCEITYGLINTISSDTTDKHNTNFIDSTLTRSSIQVAAVNEIDASKDENT